MKKLAAILMILALLPGSAYGLAGENAGPAQAEEGVQANADGMISEEDFFGLFDRAIEAFDALEETYEPVADAA